MPFFMPERLSSAGRQYATALMNSAGSRFPNFCPSHRVIRLIHRQAAKRQISQNSSKSDSVMNFGTASSSEILIAGASSAGKP